MATQQIEQMRVGRRRMIGTRMGIALVALVALMVAAWLTLPVSTQPGISALEQPSIGRNSVVTGLVFDGTRYTSAPIAVAVPSAGHGYAVTILVFDGMTYRSVPAHVGGR
jgi:hypothetical protein